MARSAQKPAVHPVTLKQKYILDQAVHPDCPDDLRDQWILATAYLVCPGIDLRRFKRAVEKLSHRHDSLRMRFDRVKGNWRAIIHPPGDDLVRVIDLGELDDAAFSAEISAIANASMPIIESHLAELIVVKCGQRGDVLITRIHHAITDGYGMVILTEDLVKLLIGMPILGKAISFADYLARFQSPLPSRAASVQAFWDEMHHDFPKAPNVGRVAKGLEPLVYGYGKIAQKQITFSATQKSLKAFKERAGQANLSDNTLLMAGHLAALCDNYDLDRAMYVTHISRTNPALGTYMGDHTHDAILPFHATDKRGLMQSAEKLSSTLFQAMENLPSAMATRGTPHEDALIEAGCFPTQFSLYQPRPVVRQGKSIFSDGFFAEYGEEQRIGPFTLSGIDVSVNNRILFEMELNIGAARERKEFTILYDGFGYSEDEIRELGERSCDFLSLDLAEIKAS